MSEELNKDAQAPEELSGGDLDKAVGGAAVVSDPDEGGDYEGGVGKKNVIGKTNLQYPGIK